MQTPKNLKDDKEVAVLALHQCLWGLLLLIQAMWYRMRLQIKKKAEGGIEQLWSP